MMSIKRLLLVLFVTASVGLNGQYTKEFKRIFFDADYLYETEFYEEAFNRYKNLLTLDPGNSNILFHCGACCLNIPGKEAEAITYLQEAIEGVTSSYKEGKHRESGAPVLTYFMLGQAYHLNYMFDEAIKYYTLYLENGNNQVPMQLDYTRMQIEACKRAAELNKNRPHFDFESVLGYFDDDLPSCSNPVISGAGDVLIFLVDYPSDKKIMESTKTDGIWSRPRVINSEIGMVGETYPTSMSYDGTELYLVHHYYSHSDIFISRFDGERWSEAEALGYNINGRTSENHASISKDGKSLYFTSDVRGGSGSFDIYVSRLDEKGDWGEAVNLGSTINTPFEEHTPFVAGNDSVLFFSSQGHGSIGGLDVFYSRMNSYGVWSEPVSVGYPVNTTGDDEFFNPGWDELEAYYAVPRPDDPTSTSINMVMGLEYEDEPFTVPIASVEVVSDTLQAGRSLASDTAEAAAAHPPTLTAAIEPEETDEIEEVLNQGVDRPETQQTTLPVVVSGPSVPLMHETVIPFDHDDYHLNMAALLEVEKIADLMTDYPDTQAELTGHTDATGAASYNMQLSLKRAEEVALYLEHKSIERKRILVNGKGETSPVAINQHEDGSDAPLGRYLNRQVRVKVAGSIPAVSGLAGVYVPDELKRKEEPGEATTEITFLYTIQISAARTPIPLSRFDGVEKVTEYHCKDGYYRYTSGSFNSFPAVTEQVMKIRESGFADAYIQTIQYYEQAMK